MSKADTKIQIVDTAIDLFWKSSYHATNMNALGDAAGMNKATVYQHFRSKEAIAIAALHRAVERTEGWVFADSMEAHNDPLDQLDSIYQSYESLYEAGGLMRGCPFVNIGVELSISSDGVRNAVQQAFSVFEGYYRQIVEALAKDGRLKPDAPLAQLASDLQDNMNATLTASKIRRNPQVILDRGARAQRYLVGKFF